MATTRAAQDAELAATAREVRTSVVRLARRLRRERQDHEVSWSGLSILSRLHRHGALTPGAMAEGEGVSPQTLTRVLAALQGRGLVSRQSDPADGRQALLALTPTGLRVLQEDSSRREEWLAQAMANELTPAEQAIMRVAADLIERLADG
jgi:DNA-binding MarR family transcriptional regulator